MHVYTHTHTLGSGEQAFDMPFWHETEYVVAFFCNILIYKNCFIFLN